MSFFLWGMFRLPGKCKWLSSSSIWAAGRSHIRHRFLIRMLLS